MIFSLRESIFKFNQRKSQKTTHEWLYAWSYLAEMNLFHHWFSRLLRLHEIFEIQKRKRKKQIITMSETQLNNKFRTKNSLKLIVVGGRRTILVTNLIWGRLHIYKLLRNNKKNLPFYFTNCDKYVPIVLITIMSSFYPIWPTEWYLWLIWRLSHMQLDLFYILDNPSANPGFPGVLIA